MVFIQPEAVGTRGALGATLRQTVSAKKIIWNSVF
jgi:hypothetical protein